MKFADINERFNAIVEEYVSKGYTAKVWNMDAELTKGTEMVRVWTCSVVGDLDGLCGLRIMVGCNEAESYYKLARGNRGAVYGTKEAALAAAAKRHDRYMAKYTEHRPEDVTAKYFEVAKRVAQNKLGAKRVAKAELKMEKYGRVFVVTYKGKAYRLK